MKYRVVYYMESSDFGGAEQVLYNLLSELDRSSWEPVLVYQQHSGIASFVDRIGDLGISTVPVSAIEGLGDISGINRLVGTLKQLRPAVFHAQLVSNLKCTAGIICARLAGIKAVVATQHSYQKFRARRIYKVYIRFIYQRLVSMLVDRYISVSRSQAEQLKKAIPQGKVSVVHNAVRTEDFASCARSEAIQGDRKPAVLTVARLDRLKGIGYLIEAAALVPDAFFFLAGDGPERANLEERARELDIADRIIFLGRRNDIPALLHSCDIFVLPSLLEGLPLSVMEAMSASKPVIGTNIDGINDLITDRENGLLVPPGDPRALADAINLILSDERLAQRIAASARDTINLGFTQEKMIEGVTDIYSEIIRKKGITGH